MSNINLLARLSILCLVAIACSGSASKENTYEEVDECLLYRHFDDFRKAAISKDLYLVRALFSKEVAPYIDEKDIDWMSNFIIDLEDLVYFHHECAHSSCRLSFKVTHKDTGVNRLLIYFLKENGEYKINAISDIHKSDHEQFDEGTTYKPMGFLDNCLINGSPLDSDTIN